LKSKETADDQNGLAESELFRMSFKIMILGLYSF
jgi:hypothetical protein